MEKEQYDLLVKQLGEDAAKEIKTQIEAHKVEFKSLVDKINEENLTAEDFEAKAKEITDKANQHTDEVVKILKDEFTKILKDQGSLITGMQKSGTPEKAEVKTLGQMVKDTLVKGEFLEKNEELSKIANKDVFRVKGNSDINNFNKSQEIVKAAIDMTTALMLLPGSTPGTSIGAITDYGMRKVQLSLNNDTHMTDILPTLPCNDKYFGVSVEYAETDGTATTAENVAAGQSSFLIKTVEFKVFKINTLYNFSVENLEDIDQLVARIDRTGTDNIVSKIDAKILTTTGDGSTDIKGMYAAGNMTAFVAATYENKVEDANICNLIGKMKLQALLANEEVNAINMSPAQIDEIEQYKDANGNSLMDRSVKFDAQGNLTSVKGLFVVRNKNQAANTLAVYFSEAAEIGIRSGIDMVIGTNSDDLSKGMRTLVLSVRVAFGVGKPAAIIYCSDVTADIQTIDVA